ncbi:DUF6686 family protein [Winogradskyella sediminis]|uniref:Uncharacterized protein n=1 Tax=Winogradskyella sediminis TaxID=1382466 RepID=A0A1H1WQ10_9FLAO|nr:DUF6686 family protein [Winogradskyella sediminis]SDS99164.1 hypothetical protein SAMN04489797_2953 [Winogradskyella sediminis]
MCQNIKVLSKVNGGELLYCNDCDLFHLAYNNLFFVLKQDELERLKLYLDQIDAEYWEEKYDDYTVKRKIPLPSTQENLVIMFNRQELKELQTLLSYDDYEENHFIKVISVDDIDYRLILN